MKLKHAQNIQKLSMLRYLECEINFWSVSLDLFTKKHEFPSAYPVYRYTLYFCNYIKKCFEVRDLNKKSNASNAHQRLISKYNFIQNA